MVRNSLGRLIPETFAGKKLIPYSDPWSLQPHAERSTRAIRRITREEGLSAIIVEQHPQAILAISDQAAVLDRGTVVHTGAAAELSAQPELLDRLLGVAR